MIKIFFHIASLILLLFVNAESTAEQNIAENMVTLPEGCFIPNSMIEDVCFDTNSDDGKANCINEINDITEYECTENDLKECLTEDITLNECMLNTISDRIPTLISTSTSLAAILSRCGQFPNPQYNKAEALWDKTYSGMADNIKNYSIKFLMAGAEVRGVNLSTEDASQWVEELKVDPFAPVTYGPDYSTKEEQLSDEIQCARFLEEIEFNELIFTMEYYYRNYEHLFIKLFGALNTNTQE